MLLLSVLKQFMRKSVKTTLHKHGANLEIGKTPKKILLKNEMEIIQGNGSK